MTSANWDPAQYARFASARSRPATELMARIPVHSPKEIVDLGCGDGSVTSLLRARWPASKIIGVDSSQAMLMEARDRCPTVAFLELDIESWQPAERPDLIFSNAALQWVDSHSILIPRLIRMLDPCGVLAVQMPGNFEAPSHKELATLVNSTVWRSRLGHLLRESPIATLDTYVDWLTSEAQSIEAWETTDYLMLDGENAILEWMKGTALRPFLAALEADETARFLQQLADRLSKAYPRRSDGRILFPFRRIYFVASRSPGPTTKLA